MFGSFQRGDLCSDHPPISYCLTPTEDVRSISSSSKWTKFGQSGSQRVKRFFFQMATEVLSPHDGEAMRQTSKYWFDTPTAGGPAAMATEGATGGKDGWAFGTVSAVCLFTPTAKGGNRSSTTVAWSSRMLRNTQPGKQNLLLS